jgi:hypothetical protein
MLHRSIVFLFAACISAGAVSALAQESSAPKSPGQIAAASRVLAKKNEDCRLQSKQQGLRFLKRRRFIRDCVKKHP